MHPKFDACVIDTSPGRATSECPSVRFDVRVMRINGASHLHTHLESRVNGTHIRKSPAHILPESKLNGVETQRKPIGFVFIPEIKRDNCRAFIFSVHRWLVFMIELFRIVFRSVFATASMQLPPASLSASFQLSSVDTHIAYRTATSISFVLIGHLQHCNKRAPSNSIGSLQFAYLPEGKIYCTTCVRARITNEQKTKTKQK